MSSEQVVVYKYDSEKPSLYTIRMRLSSSLSYCYNSVLYSYTTRCLLAVTTCSQFCIPSSKLETATPRLMTDMIEEVKYCVVLVPVPYGGLEWWRGHICDEAVESPSSSHE